MKARCDDPSNAGFADYGARGIAVCPEWSSDFATFLADMGERPAGMTIDRTDNDKGYEPGNCRWATAVEQNRNRRGAVLIGGVPLRVAAAAAGVPHASLYTAIKRGEDPASALRRLCVAPRRARRPPSP